MMTSTMVVETSVITVVNSLSQFYSCFDDQTTWSNIIAIDVDQVFKCLQQTEEQLNSNLLLQGVLADGLSCQS